MAVKRNIDRKRLRVILDMDYLGAGFQVAMEDLRLRGPGEVLGTRQTGLLQFRVADPLRDRGLLEQVTAAAGELMARIRNALRKHVPENGGVPLEERLQVKNLVMYPKRYEVEVDGETVHLTKKEYSLLEYMMRNKRTVLTRDQILEKVWGYDYGGDTNVVDVYIRYLRAKLDDRFHEKYIYTVRGVGYAVKE